MTKSLLQLISLLIFLGASIGTAFSSDDQANHPKCSFCGMDRSHFAHSRMMVTYEDGTSVGTCSIHCLAIEFALSVDKTPSDIKVGDYQSKQLIEAEKAFWTIGGGKPGVMTQRAKWAFKNKEDAEKFIADNGGTLVSFEEAMKAAYEDMYSDTKMIREKRKGMKSMHPVTLKQHSDIAPDQGRTQHVSPSHQGQHP